MYKAASLTGFILLASCAAPDTPPPQAAQVTSPSQWRQAVEGTESVPSNWWTVFGDPQLDMWVDRAIENNDDLAIAVARIKEARAQIGLARSALLPTLSAGGGGSYSRSVSALGQPLEQFAGQPQVQAAWEVDLFGRLSDQLAAARDAWLATRAAHDAVKLSVAAATANAYITLVGLDERRTVVEQTIAARAEALRLARARAQAGYTSELELRQAEAEYRGTVVILPQVDLAIAKAENAIHLLAGDVPGPVQRASSLSLLTLPSIPNVGLPSELLRRRPDIAQAELSLAATDKKLSVARKQFLPSVNLNAAAGATYASALGDPITIWSIGGSILAPLFAGGRLTANAEATAAQRDQAAFAYRKAALTAFREVEDAIASVDSLKRQRDETESQRTAIAETLRHATNRYRAGYSPYLEQLDAQRALLAADLTLVQLKVDQLNAQITLRQTLGGGWEGESQLMGALQ